MNRKIACYKRRYLGLINNEKFSRLGRTFNTTKFKYFYDTGTGKIGNVYYLWSQVL